MKEQQNNKIEQALSLYNYDMTDEQVREAVKKIIAEKVLRRCPRTTHWR